MRPIKIELRNFMPYGTAVVPFYDLHIACLSGDNGAGKSAILDAITWVLWGKARGARLDDLVKQGEQDMSVRMSFEVGGTTYDVLRQRGKNASALSVTMGGKDISGATIKDSQAVIDSVVKMGYETFVNSALLLQGRADEFTVKTPAQRKQVLSDILCLGQWAIYEEMCKAELKRIEEERVRIEQKLDDVTTRLEDLPELLAQLDRALGAATTAAEELATKDATLERKRRASEELERVKAQATHAKAQLDKLRAELRRASGEEVAHSAALARFDDLLSKSHGIDAGYQVLLERRRLLAELDKKQTEKLGLELRLTKTEADVARGHAAMAAELTRLQGLSEHKRGIISAAPRLAEINSLIAQEEKLIAVVTLKSEKETEKESVAKLLYRAKADADFAKCDIDTIERRLAELLSSSNCPECGQPINVDKVSLDTKEKLCEVKRKLDENERDASMHSELLDKIKAAISECSESIKELAGVPAKLAVALESRKRAENAEEELDAIAKSMAMVQEKLDSQDFARDAFCEIEEIKAAIDSICYNEEAHHSMRVAVDSLAPFEQEYQQLQEARQQAADAQRKLEAAQETKLKLELEIEAAQQSADYNSAKADELIPKADGLQEAARAAAAAKANKGVADMAVGAAKQRLADCEALKPERDRLEKGRDKLAKQSGIYSDLQKAFGKGVPALIIDTALPEIENTANELLARLSSGRMHLRFDTQRETLKGDTVETLAIYVSDELGTRPYENFSGGEQFRANFAIRIALSKLLARRAGARLQTLVIDEGFGALDSAGRGQLVEAINAVSGDFDLILAVTHIDELRDMFGSRIEVKKTHTPQGSIVKIV